MSNDMKAKSIMDFVNEIAGAHEAGCVGNTFTIAQLYEVARNHCSDELGVEVPTIAEQWGEDAVRDLSVKPASTANEWISVKDRLPAYGEPVLICANSVVQNVTYVLTGLSLSILNMMTTASFGGIRLHTGCLYLSHRR